MFDDQLHKFSLNVTDISLAAHGIPHVFCPDVL